MAIRSLLTRPHPLGQNTHAEIGEVASGQGASARSGPTTLDVRSPDQRLRCRHAGRCLGSPKVSAFEGICRSNSTETALGTGWRASKRRALKPNATAAALNAAAIELYWEV